MNGKTRVLAVSHSCLVAENHKLWEHLARRGRFDLTLLVPPRFRAALRDHRLEKVHDPDYTIVPAAALLSGNRFSNHLHFYRQRIRRLLRDTPPDIVFVQEEPWSLSMRQVVFLRRPRSRVVFYTCQNQVKRYPFPFNVFRGAALRASNAAVAVCNDAKDVLERQGYRKPVHVLPLGVDTASFTPDGHRRRHWRRKLALDGFVVGYIGRLTAAKGVFDLLGALARLGPAFRLLVIGDGPDKDAFVRCAAGLGLADRVTTAGVVPHGEMSAILPAMDALVLPSHTTAGWKEQFGRVLIEAMACGVAVVGSDSGEVPATMGGAGLVFPEADPSALARALDRLRSRPALRRSLVKRGARRARQFSWDAVAGKLGDIFQQVLDADQPARAAAAA